MASLTNIGRIDCASDDAREAIRDLRRQLSPRGDVVSPQGRARTIAAFGEPLTPEQVVERICDDVQAAGSTPCSTTPRRLDRRRRSTRASVRVSPEELADGLPDGRPGLPADDPPGPRQHPGLPVGHPPPRRHVPPGHGVRAAAPLSAAPAGRRLRPGRGGGLSVVAPDDGRPGAGGGGRARSPWSSRRRRSAATTPTSSPPATPWA